MSKFYAKSPGNEGYIKNMEVLSHHDCDDHYLFQSQLYKTKDGKYWFFGTRDSETTEQLYDQLKQYTGQ